MLLYLCVLRLTLDTTGVDVAAGVAVCKAPSNVRSFMTISCSVRTDSDWEDVLVHGEVVLTLGVLTSLSGGRSFCFDLQSCNGKVAGKGSFVITLGNSFRKGCR